MTKIIIGFAIAFALGAVCRLFQLPTPAPPSVIGALLVAAVTVGYVVTDRILHEPNKPANREISGGMTHSMIFERPHLDEPAAAWPDNKADDENKGD